MLNFPIGQWQTLTPPGLTPTGRMRRFQDRTVTRLKARAQEIGRETLAALRTGVEQTYTEGEGTLLSTLQSRTIASRDGVSVEFIAGGRHLVYLTALAGEPFASPGHFIPRAGRSRFYWKRLGRWVTFTPQNPAHWKTRQGRDVLAQVLEAGAQTFTQAMIAEHDRLLVEFVQNDLKVTSKSPRVNVAGR